MKVEYFNEIDPFRCDVLRKNFPAACVDERDIREVKPKEIKTFKQAHWFGGIGGFALACRWAEWEDELWTGGFPCQDISCAGKGVGLQGERSGLWFEWLRLIQACRPVRLLIENVPALRTRGYDRIHDALEEVGYTVRPIVVGAWAVGAPHRRNRIWIIANLVGAFPNAESNGRRARSGKQGDESEAERRRGEPAGSVQLADAAKRGVGTDGSARNAGYADERGASMAVASEGNDRRRTNADGDAATRAEAERCDGSSDPKRSNHHRQIGCNRWPCGTGSKQYEWEVSRLVKSGVGVAVDGLPRRMAGFARRNALQALGDSIVPQVAAAILRAWKMSLA